MGGDLKAVEEVQHAEAVARRRMEQAAANKQGYMDEARKKADALVADAETEAKAHLEQVQEKTVKELASRRADEDREIKRAAGEARGKTIPKDAIPDVVRKAIRLIVGG